MFLLDSAGKIKQTLRFIYLQTRLESRGLRANLKVSGSQLAANKRSSAEQQADVCCHTQMRISLPF